MKKTNKMLKLIIIVLTAVQVFYLVACIMYGFAILAVSTNLIHIRHEATRAFLSSFDVEAMGGTLFMVFSTVIQPLIMIVLFHQIKIILRDMSKGTRFKRAHVKRIYAIATMLALRGVMIGFLTVVPFMIIWSLIIKHILNGLFMGLVVIALAKIFEHGVEVQTDSDMTV